MSALYVSFQVSPTGTSAVNTAGRNAAVTSLVVCCGFIACFTPSMIVEILGISGVAVDFGSWYYLLSLVLMLSNCFINPFIYAAKYREFKHGVRTLLTKVNLIQQQQSHVAATT